MIVRFNLPRCHVASLVMSFAQINSMMTPEPGPVTRTGSTSSANAVGMLYLVQAKPTSMIRTRARLMSACLQDAAAAACERACTHGPGPCVVLMMLGART